MSKSMCRVMAVMLLLSDAPAQAANTDCRTCHVEAGPGASMVDFSAIYAAPQEHHPVGVVYPDVFNENFNAPLGQAPDIVFFDANSDGIPDENEVQLFGFYGSATVECASCHRDHAAASPRPPGSPRDFFLRVENASSALCLTCHKY